MTARQVSDKAVTADERAVGDGGIVAERQGAWDPLFNRVAAAYVLIAVALLLVVTLATGPGDPLPGSEGLGWIQGWARWDSGWYRVIAVDGYSFSTDTQSSVAFFPAYPLLMKVGGAGLPVFLVGYLVTVVSGLVSCLLFARWCLDRMPRVPAIFAVALLMLYPYSYYLYGAVYADALFLACALGAFVLLERGQPLLAGLIGIAATAGRPVGVAVLVGLAVRAAELAAQRSPAGGHVPQHDDRTRGSALLMRVGTTARQLTLRDSSVLLAGLGLAGWCVYQWVTFDNPLAFVAAESAWGQGSGVDVWLKVSFFQGLSFMSPQAILKLAAPGVGLLVAIALLPRVKRRFGWGYLVFAAIALGMPLLGTKDFLGVGRYLFVAFPVFAIAGELVAGLRPAWLRATLLAASMVGLVVGAACFGAGLLIA